MILKPGTSQQSISNTTKTNRPILYFNPCNSTHTWNHVTIERIPWCICATDLTRCNWTLLFLHHIFYLGLLLVDTSVGLRNKDRLKELSNTFYHNVITSHLSGRRVFTESCQWRRPCWIAVVSVAHSVETKDSPLITGGYNNTWRKYFIWSVLKSSLCWS